jgi:hypothetical protein
MPNTEPSPSSSPTGRWRAFVARPGAGQQVDLDLGELDWATARELLLDRILPLLASGCACCREAAMECLHELDNPQAADIEFLGEIDGMHYVLTASR